MGLHIDAYVSPVSWDDLEMDWSSPDAQDARYVDALCCAIRERYKVLGSNIALPAIRPDMRLSYANLKTIHDATLALVPQFLNSDTPVLETMETRTVSEAPSNYDTGEAYSGTYEYQSCSLNYWTAKACLASFGDSILLSPQPYALDNSPWLRQQYQLLNKLTTLSNSSLACTQTSRMKLYESKGGTTTTTDWGADESITYPYNTEPLVYAYNGCGYWVSNFDKAFTIYVGYYPYGAFKSYPAGYTIAYSKERQEVLTVAPLAQGVASTIIGAVTVAVFDGSFYPWQFVAGKLSLLDRTFDIPGAYYVSLESLDVERAAGAGAVFTLHIGDITADLLAAASQTLEYLWDSNSQRSYYGQGATFTDVGASGCSLQYVIEKFAFAFLDE